MGVNPSKVKVRNFVAWIAGRREINSLKPIDKPIFRMVSKPSGRNESKCGFGSETLTLEVELSLTERRQHEPSQAD